MGHFLTGSGLRGLGFIGFRVLTGLYTPVLNITSRWPETLTLRVQRSQFFKVPLKGSIRGLDDFIGGSA